MKQFEFEKIYLGASLSVLLNLYFEKKNVLVLEKENFLGGAWKIGTGKYNNLDLACHLIVPSSNKESIKITNFFTKLRLNVREVFKKEFYADTDSWQSYGKGGPAMICSEGWPKMLNILQKIVEKKKNIKIVKKTVVTKLLATTNHVKVITKRKSFEAKQVFFPSYFSLNHFYLNGKKELLPRIKITNYHFLITLNCEVKLLTKNFQCFYSKDSDYLFDRISVSSFKNYGGFSKTIITARIGKNYKSKYQEIKKKEIISFLIRRGLAKKIFSITFKVIDYNCYYRDIKDRKKTIISLKKSNKKIIWLNTMYFGHFISNLLKKNS
jgi:hypothetical protein